MAYIELSLAALAPAITAWALFQLERKGKFKHLSSLQKNILFGVIFGVWAICGTEYGIPVNGAQINCRDAAVLIAGLFFGEGAGVLAGLIGGIERWVAVAWGVGTYTRIACSVSTILAGIVSALIRHYVLEGKKPNWGVALFVSIGMEVFHLMMVFFTNMNDAEHAIRVVRSCSLPLILANGISVLLTVLFITLATKKSAILHHKKMSETPVFETIQSGMLMIIVVCLIATCLFVYHLEDNLSQKQTNTLLQNAIEDTTEELDEWVNKNSSRLAEETLNSQVKELVAYSHVGQGGFVVILNDRGQVIASRSEMENSILDSIITTPISSSTLSEVTINDTAYYYQYSVDSGYYICALYPVEEAVIQRDMTVYLTIYLIILVFMAIYLMLYLIIKRIVIDQIVKMADSLSMITAGQLDTVVDASGNEEFASLSKDINKTVEKLKMYIAEAAARIDAELEMSAKIQESALPDPQYAFPKRKDFEIYAKMDPAKEVGGDFYDFYLTTGHELNIMIADVSGKGIPAAMFMMRAKSTLKDLTDGGDAVNDVFTMSNNLLCEGNDAEMFVTAWQGKIHLDTGLVEYANAGHNPPLVKHGDGQFEYLRQKKNLVLAAMEGIQYTKNEFTIQPGDIILLYTDGVVEATNNQNELYGEARLQAIVNSRTFSSVREMLAFIREDVDKFVGEASQFDDLTMLGFKFNGDQSTIEKLSINKN